MQLNENEKLALYGGTPVRSKRLPPPYPGAAMYDDAEKASVDAVIDARSPFRYYGLNLLGKVAEFERAMCDKLGVRHALAVSSCTASLVVALKAAGIGPGHKVIVPACTFIATAGAVVAAGAVPVFADIDDSLNIDPEKIGDCVDEETKALIVVPILGNACEMDKIMAQAKKYNLIVIEDVAQSMGLRYKGQYCGSFGHLGCFSLQMNKMITSGEGGAVTTNDDKLYERAVRYHDHGMFRESEGFLGTSSDSDIFIGQNYRMSEIAGAVAVEQFKKLDRMIAAMRKLKYYIKTELQKIPGLAFRRITDEEGDTGNAIILLLPSKELGVKFREALNAENVHLNCLYNGQPIYMVPQLLGQRTADANGFPFNMVKNRVEYFPEMCPFAAEILPKNLVINITPEFTKADADDIIHAIQKVAAQLL